MGTINDDPILRNVEAAEYLGVSPSWLAAARMTGINVPACIGRELEETWPEARTRGLFERLFLLAGVAVPRSAASARYMREHLHGVRVPEDVITALEAAGPEAEDVGVRLTVDVVNRLRTVPGIAGCVTAVS